MAEEEKIQQHAKKALRSLTNKKKKWKERIKDFLWEILIIVVAVNVTLWFHNWSDKRHEQAQVKEFLIGVRENLIQDTSMLQKDIVFIKNTNITYYDTILKQINENKIDAKYIDSNSLHFISASSLLFDNALFQSFSSSGNLRLLKNQKLLTHITLLYNSMLPLMEQSTKEIYDKRRDYYVNYIVSKTGIDSNYNCKLSAIIHQPEVKYQIQWYDNVEKEIIRHYNDLTDEIVTLIHEIDRELKDNFDDDTAQSNK